ncbi:TetR/AcrR family transcriptional regulator [Parahaliea mediterranea]|uniref:TetR/AcrR family transcriptional regulator n=1 Tax=Parahaliea mediterranea TaxID=651086 RepID=A0A939IJN7_9GAMM|nr:TetR/AcrR family transcriptional regulator [Parahaliea mediterranea]MBN7796486.1 TetR/AcrR family transcriptional regulator [Parahaliea mediterranea]
MTDKQPPRARKRPRQSRSQMTMRAIQEACLKILANEGADKLTTQRIADVAGVNIASLYQYFPNKEAILSDVYEARVAELAQQAACRFRDIQTLADRSVADTLAAIIDMECEQLLALQQLDPDFFREYQHSFDIHQRVDELTQSLDNPSWDDWLGQWLDEQHCDGHPRLRGPLLRQTLQGNLRGALLEQPSLLADAEYRGELLALLLRYLGHDGPRLD